MAFNYEGSQEIYLFDPHIKTYLEALSTRFPKGYK
jgi:hypothetical protein